VNICLAAVLVRNYRGAGIALALSVASVVNTVMLFVFLRKNPNIVVGRALGSALFYMLKLILLSGIAAAPIYFLSPVLVELFAGRGRLISCGAPLAINAVIFALLGIGLLFVTRDKQIQSLLRVINKGKGKKDAEGARR